MSSSIIVTRDIWNIICDYIPKTRFVIKAHQQKHVILKLNHIIEIEGPFVTNNGQYGYGCSYFRVYTIHKKKECILVYNTEHYDAYNAIAEMIK